MRYLITFLAFLAAAPAMAQQGDICKGRKSFELSDGSKGCLLEVSRSHITHSVTIDNVPNRSKDTAAAVVQVAMFGDFQVKWKYTTPRLREICKTFQADAVAAQKGEKFRSIIVHMHWPAENIPAKYRTNGGVLHQSGFTNKNCRSVQYFGTRTN